MNEVVCENAKCGKLFQARSAKSRFCGPTCQHYDWINKNREHANEYARIWYSKNPEIIAKYNEKRRTGWATIQCANPKCGKTFEKRSGASKYCTVRCRNKVRWQRPHERQANLLRARKWVAANREKTRASARKHYRKHAVRKHQIEPWRSLLEGRKRDAKKKQLPFELDSAWAKARWTGNCELTGIPFNPPEKRVGYKNRNFSPSIDKIVPALGYTKENSRFVLWAINSLKRDGTDKEMFSIMAALMKTKQPNVGDFALATLSLPG